MNFSTHFLGDSTGSGILNVPGVTPQKYLQVPSAQIPAWTQVTIEPQKPQKPEGTHSKFYQIR